MLILNLVDHIPSILRGGRPVAKFPMSHKLKNKDNKSGQSRIILVRDLSKASVLRYFYSSNLIVKLNVPKLCAKDIIVELLAEREHTQH